MPVNYQVIRQQIIEKGKQAPGQHEEIRRQIEQAGGLLEKNAEKLEMLRLRVAEALETNSNLRCAVPLRESLSLALSAPVETPPHVLLAADGSQINPSRHDPVEFGVINIGAIRMQPGLAQPPMETTSSRFLCFDDLRTPEGPLTEEIVALRRDLDERKILAELAESETLPVIALTDGPLELYREPKGRSEYNKTLREYLEVLNRLSVLQTATAGYVDRTHTDMVVRLLELVSLSNEELHRAGMKSKLDRITDADIFAPMLGPYQRSAVFAIQSPSAQKFEGSLALHFFYLNVGKHGQSSTARVEIPAWVAHNPDLTNLLHGALVDQCRLMGSRPFPYALHRAHEIAIIKLDEKERISDMFIMELRSNGVNVGGTSFKQAAKDHSGIQTRYKL